MEKPDLRRRAGARVPRTPDSDLAAVASGSASLEDEVRELRAALDHAEEAIVRVGTNGVIDAVNRAAAAMAERSADDLVGRSWMELVAPADHAAARDVVRVAVTGKIQRTLRGARRDGAVFEMRLTAVPILDEDAVQPVLRGHYLYLRDLAERRRMENQLIVAGRMAAVGTLAAGVAHEINNPLAYIVANIDFCRQQMAGLGPRLFDDDDAQRGLGEVSDALAEARQGAERVRNIVRDLRVFARGDEEARGPVGLRRVLDSSINMAWNEIRHRARLVKDYGEVPLVEGNESRLGQVFLNLLLNAAQAVDEGESDRNEIRVSTSTDPSGRAIVEVRDTGHGIPAAHRARIFDPFFSTKSAGEGTGLGLWICQGILGSMGGEIAVESEEGSGSLFRVTLPPAAMEAPARRSRSTLPPFESDRQGSRLLVIDDEPMILGALRRALASDYQVTCESDARTALARLRAGERFDAILCDLMMPEMTGIDFFDEMARLPVDQTDRVIFVTGGAFTARAREFLERIPNARVEKPIDFQNLRMLIRNLVR